MQPTRRAKVEYRRRLVVVDRKLRRWLQARIDVTVIPGCQGRYDLE
jgi:hypothetical protein